MALFKVIFFKGSKIVNKTIVNKLAFLINALS